MLGMFKKIALRGTSSILPSAVIIGAAFNSIVTSLVLTS